MYKLVWCSLGYGLHKCPHCNSKSIVATPQVKQTSKGGSGYSLLRGEDYLDADADAELYTDGRPSEDIIRPDAATESKGKTIEEV